MKTAAGTQAARFKKIIAYFKINFKTERFKW